MKSETQKTLPFYQLCAPICALVFAAGLAACSTSGGTVDTNSPKAQATAEADKRLTASQLRAFCPPVTIREGTSVINNYGKTADKNPANLIYQASMSDETRSCNSDDTTMTMTVAVSGKIVPGAKFTPGTVTVPIRVAVIQGSDVVYSKLSRQAVAVNDSGAATQFIFNDPNVSFPKPASRNVQVFVGFDEGPDDSAKAKTKKKN
ncbi:hypothetical protein SAMN04515648_0430 [Phyllobacterium sp. CL33Tsu]|jgi:hypothetical protein|uniref:hypothetical protein n=1 Tax=Phyllobacterium sp. CL33Tsu TaxID=1798191 RepID=UPI0008EF8542|nr:hypothetical protein [Phyllobacterium sp. CL33Tsu]SFI54739.1 hypothetical protein SAMN04515648_0430 [Phyllobacterium sp. CL33Tsu]